MKNNMPERGFTLLIAVILSSVALALGLALIDVSYKQVTLALASKQSQYAFANADTALECALYYDQKQDAFNYDSPSSSITCGTMAVTGYATSQSGGVRTTSFTIPCETSGTAATITVRKQSNATTAIYANGYSVCSTSDARRIERGVKATY